MAKSPALLIGGITPATGKRQKLAQLHDDETLLRLPIPARYLGRFASNDCARVRLLLQATTSLKQVRVFLPIDDFSFKDR